MKKILRFIFNRYRNHFEDFFIEDMFGNIPSAMTENALKFLLTGGNSFDKWIRMSSYSLQRKLTDKALGPSAAAGLLFFRTLDTMISRLQAGKSLQPLQENTPPPPDLIDSMRGVDEFFKNRKVDNNS